MNSKGQAADLNLKGCTFTPHVIVVRRYGFYNSESGKENSQHSFLP